MNKKDKLIYTKKEIKKKWAGKHYVIHFCDDSFIKVNSDEYISMQELARFLKKWIKNKTN